MKVPLRALLIEDSEDDALLLTRTLREGGYEPIVERVDTPQALRTMLKRQEWDVVISDYVMPQFSAPAALAMLKESKLDLPFIIVSGAIGEETAVAAMRAGAHDYLMKGSLARLVPVIEREIQEATNRRERRRAEEMLARLGRILDSSSNEIYVFDAETLRCVQVNQGACQNLGYSKEELGELSLLDVQPQLSSAELSLLLAPLRSGEQDQVIFESLQLRKDGSRYPVEVRLQLSHTESPPVFVAITQNIADRKRVEETQRFLSEAGAVLSSSLDYETTLANLARLVTPGLADWCLVDVVEDDGRIRRAIACGHDEQKHLPRELERSYVSGSSASHRLPVLLTGRPMLIAEMTDALLESLALDGEHLSVLRAMKPRSAIAAPLVARGRILGALSLLSSDSSRCYGPDDLALAEELAQRAAVAVDNARLYQETERALRMRDQFLSIAAHELKTPITALLGYAQLLQRRAERESAMSSRDQRALLALSDQSRRLHRLITSLLDLSRMQAGTLDIERGLLDLCALSRRMCEELQPTLERHRIEWHGPDTPVVVEGDELRLEQVLQNLLQNAIKYSPDSDVVTVDITSDASQVHIAVTDHGIGIPPDAVARIFNRFYRAENAELQQIGGMGVGLYVVKEIVTLHGGVVDVQSAVSQGSTFSVSLPLHKGSPVMKDQSSPAEQGLS